MNTAPARPLAPLLTKPDLVRYVPLAATVSTPTRGRNPAPLTGLTYPVHDGQGNQLR